MKERQIPTFPFTKFVFRCPTQKLVTSGEFVFAQPSLIEVKENSQSTCDNSCLHIEPKTCNFRQIAHTGLIAMKVCFVLQHFSWFLYPQVCCTKCYFWSATQPEITLDFIDYELFVIFCLYEIYWNYTKWKCLILKLIT